MSAEDFALLSEDDRADFITAYGDDLLKTEAGRKLVEQEAQSRRDREAAEAAGRPDADAVYQSMSRQVADHLESLGKLADMDPAEIDPMAISENSALLHEWTEATTHRVGFQAVNYELGKLAQQVFGQIDASKPPDDPAYAAANDAWNAAMKAYSDAGRQVDRLRNSQNPATRRSAPEVETKRHRAFLAQAIEIAMQIGKSAGASEQQKADGPKQEARLRLAKSNSFREAQARAAARQGAATAAAVGSAGGADARSDDELLADPKTPIQKVLEIRRRQKSGG